MVKILFVCHGNICRSPMAEFLMKDLVRNKNTAEQFYIASAATSMEEIGNGIHRGTRAILDRLGIRDYRNKKAVQMRRQDYDEYDYLIGMDDWNIRNMQRIAGGDPQGKIYKLLTFAGRDDDVADPWYTGNFEVTYTDICQGCEALYEYIKKQGEV